MNRQKWSDEERRKDTYYKKFKICVDTVMKTWELLNLKRKIEHILYSHGISEILYVVKINVLIVLITLTFL
jgi:hypothetical protein